MHFKTLKDFEVRGKRVLLREDFNVPMSGDEVADFTRIDAALPTLRYLHDNGARTVVMSHLGRPDGLANPKYSLAPIAAALSKRLALPVAFASDCIGPQAEKAARALQDGEFLLLENVRFHPEEEKNDPGFAAQLAKLGDIYLNDAFGTAHRAHASTEGVAHLLPNAAGFLMESELRALGDLIAEPEQPFVCIIGGAKVKDKVGVFKNMIERVAAFCIGGGMANTFLAAQGNNVGKSLKDDDLEPAKAILKYAQERGVELLLPFDVVASPAFDADDRAKNIPLSQVDNLMILDIGDKSAHAYAGRIAQARTIVFNGPMGVYEKKAYQNGTKVVGEAIARATKKGAKSVVGGGDAAAAAHELGFAEAMTHVSTGGGATLEFLEGKTLPGVAALFQQRSRA
ncbi:MAG: phosphoglycerate kinase [Vulcanimicrobiaceae bacterium]